MAQGYFGAVMCNSGPMAMYDRRTLEEVWQDYLTQKYRGRRCDSGDDVHLTNLILARGHRALHEPYARARTEVPATLPAYARQQLRWNRSLYRELLWTIPAIRGGAGGMRLRLPYLCLDVAARTLPPLLMVVTVMLTGIDLLRDGPGRLADGLQVIASMLTVHAACIYAKTGDLRFTVLYGLLHVAVLVPVRVRALLSLAENRWVTRAVPPPPAPSTAADLLPADMSAA